MSERLLPHEKDFYRRNLPHLQPKNAILFLTTRLDGSLPKHRVEELKERREAEKVMLEKDGLTEKEMAIELQKVYELYNNKFDYLIDNSTTGPHWLKDDRIAKIWTDALFHFDGKRYVIICSTVMSNHVHFIFYKLDRSLGRIMKSIKLFSAREANKVLNKTGSAFWQAESFDRMIRDEDELKYRINYVLNNPVKIGLVKHWKEWRYNYLNPKFKEFVES